MIATAEKKIRLRPTHQREPVTKKVVPERERERERTKVLSREKTAVRAEQRQGLPRGKRPILASSSSSSRTIGMHGSSAADL